MITQERPAFYSNDRYAEYTGLSTDDKSAIKAYNGDEFYEIDTAKTYKYDEDGAKWVEQPASGGGGTGDLKADGSVPMTGNLQMNGNAIMGVKSISNTNSGLAIESETSLNNHKITDLLDPTAEQDATTKKYVDAHDILGDDGKVKADIDMNEHAIINAHKISTDGPAPLYIGSTIEATGTTAPRLTGATDGTAAFVKADTQAEYVPIAVGTPTTANHAATKEYVDTRHQAEYIVIKKTDAVAGNFATYQLQKDGADVGEAINIPLDYLVKSVEVKTAPAGGDDSGFAEGTQYVDFTINVKSGTGTAEHLYLKTTDICKPYTTGSVANDPVVIAISDENKITATLTDKGIVLDKLSDAIQASLGKADTALQAAVYDADGTIANAGGIKDYVSANYLPLTGGALTGRLQVDAPLGISVYTEDGDNAGGIDIYPQTPDGTDRLKISPAGVGAAIPGKDVYLYGANVRLKASEIDATAVTIKNVATPTDNNDAANKAYADTKQVKLTGTEGQVVKFNADGNAEAGTLTATDVNALPITGGTLKGNLYIAPDNTSSIIFAPMGSGAAIQFKDNNDSYLNTTIETSSSTIRLSSGASQAPVNLSGIAEPQLESSAVNLKYLTDNYVALANSKFTFPGMTLIENVATPGKNYQGANKYYVDNAISKSMDIVTGEATDIHLGEGGNINGQVTLTMPAWFVNGTSKAALSISTSVDWVSCSIVGETWAQVEGEAATVVVRYLLVNTSISAAATTKVKVSCVAIK